MADRNTRLLVLGASGMLGNAMLRFFAQSAGYEVWGTVRSTAAQNLLPLGLRARLVRGINVACDKSVSDLLAQVRPHALVNCIGLVKQLAEAKDPISAIAVNSLLPHRLARLCEPQGVRLVHVSTDCVFSGGKGLYREEDYPDAQDLYGRSKLLGEVDRPNVVTLRTSIIGHELAGAHGLVDWFLAQSGAVKGFTRAVFSGLPTVELAGVLRDYLLPRPELQGLYHVSADPISKYELLKLLAEIYGRATEIRPSAELAIDRSLDSTRFRTATGYAAPPWPELVRAMYRFG